MGNSSIIVRSGRLTLRGHWLVIHEDFVETQGLNLVEQFVDLGYSPDEEILLQYQRIGVSVGSLYYYSKIDYVHVQQELDTIGVGQ